LHSLNLHLRFIRGSGWEQLLSLDQLVSFLWPTPQFEYFVRPCPTSSALTLPTATCNTFQYNNIPTLFIAVMQPRFFGCSIYLQAVGQGDLVITGFICSLFSCTSSSNNTQMHCEHMATKGSFPPFWGWLEMAKHDNRPHMNRTLDFWEADVSC